MSVVLDAGALVAVDKRDRRIGAMLRVLHAEAIVLKTSAGAVSQVWRDGSKQANLARLVSVLRVIELDLKAAKHVGALLAKTGSCDIVDAHVASLVRDGERLLTSDVDDMRRLLNARGVEATIVQV